MKVAMCGRVVLQGKSMIPEHLWAIAHLPPLSQTVQCPRHQHEVLNTYGPR